MSAHVTLEPGIAMREFYAATPDAPIESLADKLAAVKREGVIHSLGKLAGRELIVAEGAHAGFFRQADDIPFEFDREEAGLIIAGVQADAMAMAEAAVVTAEEMQAVRDRNLLFKGFRPVPKRVMGGMVLGAVAYNGMKRKSGRDYYEHPNEMVTCLRIAWRRWNRPDEFLINQNVLEGGSFLFYLHDGWEDSYKKSTQTYLNHEVVISPLVGEYTLNLLGYGHQSQELSHANLLLTHPVGVDDDGRPRKSPYDHYALRGLHARCCSHWFALGKAVDNQHNRVIEPKIVVHDDEISGKSRKSLLYLATQDNIVEYVQNEYESELLRFVMRIIPHITREDVTLEKKRQPSIATRRAVTIYNEVLGWAA